MDDPQPMTQDLPQGAPQAAPEPLSSDAGATQAGGVQAPPASPAEQWVSIADYGKTQGLDLSHLGDDEKVIAHLFDAYRQLPSYQQLARYGNEYLQLQNDPRWKQYQQSLYAAPGQPAPGPAGGPAGVQQPQGWWNPPTAYDEVQQLKARWYQQDPQTGQLAPGPATPPSVVQKVEEGERYYQDWAKKVLSNPQEAFGPLVKDLAQKQFQDLAAKQQTQQVAQQIVARHAPWMFQANPQTGMPQYGFYTPDGMAFWQHVQNAERMGIKDPYDQEYFALSQLQLSRFQAMQQAQPRQPQAPAPAPTQQPPPQHPAARHPSAAPPGPASVPQGAVNLAALIRRDLNANGITHFNVPEG